MHFKFEEFNYKLPILLGKYGLADIISDSDSSFFLL